MADISHLALPTPVHLQWVGRLENELFLQGDQERRRGLPISPLMDRNAQGITRSQVRRAMATACSQSSVLRCY